MTLTFEPITLDRQAEYNERLGHCTQIASDYSIVNIWGWGPDYGLEWAWTDQLVWIRQQRPLPALWAPLGPWSEVDWPKALADVSIPEGGIIRVPETLCALWDANDRLSVVSDTDQMHWDYLYSIEELIGLKGNRFHKKKNLVNQFNRKYVSEYIPYGPEMIQRAKELQADWCAWRDCEASDTLIAENLAIGRVLENWEQFDRLCGGALAVEERLVAYTISEVMPDDSVVIHFEKADPRIKGAYQAINQRFLSEAVSHLAIVNREQDLGDPGLRKAKLSYNPTGYVEKHIVRNLTVQG